MGYVKVLKNNTYFKRYQVKFARRRIGKTDYRARLRLTVQDKNKYNTPKYRMIVRFTNRDIICQIAYSTMAGDRIISAAYSHELPRYGMKAGLTNYAAAYATGLLLARRTLKKLGLAETYEGNTEGEVGEDYTVEQEGDKAPFKALLDVGLVATSTGNRVFGALKGALDGGINIPHNEKRYAGYDSTSKELDAETHGKYITGGIIAEYAEEMKDEEPEEYVARWAKYLSNDMDPVEMEEIMEKVHENIRANPDMEKKARKKPKENKRWLTPKLTYEQRKANLTEKLTALQAVGSDSEEASDSD